MERIEMERFGREARRRMKCRNPNPNFLKRGIKSVRKPKWGRRRNVTREGHFRQGNMKDVKI